MGSDESVLSNVAKAEKKVKAKDRGVISRTWEKIKDYVAKKSSLYSEQEGALSQTRTDLRDTEEELAKAHAAYDFRDADAMAYQTGLEKANAHLLDTQGKLEAALMEVEDLKEIKTALPRIIAIVKAARERYLSENGETRLEEHAFDSQVEKGARYPGEWAKGLEQVAAAQVYDAERRAKAYQEAGIGLAVEAFLANRSLKKVALVYYNFVSGQVYSTPAAQKVLKLKLSEKKTSLKGLIGTIGKFDKDEANVRKKLFEAMKKKLPLSHVHAVSSRTGKDLRLTTRPYFLDEEGKEPTGMAILLDDPSISVRTLRHKRTLKGIGNLIGDVKENIASAVEGILEEESSSRLVPIKT
jgi:hypothetical protein